MDETKLNKILDGLRYDLDMLLKNHFSLDEGSYYDIKTKVENATTNINEIYESVKIFFNSMIDYRNFPTLYDKAVGATSTILELIEDVEQLNNSTGTNTDLQSTIDALQTDVTLLQSEVENLKQNVEQNTTNIDNLQQNVLTLDERVTTLESSGGGSGTGDLSGLEADIETLQNDITNLQLQINGVKSHYDPYYIGKTFSDYPAGTILQSYDYYEQKLNMITTGKAEIPVTYFCAEIGSEGMIKAHVDFNVKLLAKNVAIEAYLNDTLLSTDDIEVTEIDTNYTYDKEFVGLSLNTEAKGNNFKLILALEGSASNTRQLNVTNYKVEIFAPNADIINKVCPYDAIRIQDNYIVTNCTTGTAKVATIGQLDIINVDNLQYTDTGTSAMFYKLRPYYTKYNSVGVYKNNGIHVYGGDGKHYTYYEGAVGETDTSFTSRDAIDLQQERAMAIKLRESDGRICLAQVTTSSSYIFGDYVAEGIAIHGCVKINEKPLTSNSFAPFVIITKDGMARLYFARNSDYLELGYGHSASVYVTNEVDYKNASLEVYLKYYDKIICYKVELVAQVLNLIEVTEVGHYDKYFKMPNNDYFVVRGKTLTYHKFNQTTTEETTAEEETINE